jgi:hypothetical protein
MTTKVDGVTFLALLSHEEWFEKKNSEKKMFKERTNHV